MKQWSKIEIASGDIFQYRGQEIFISVEKQPPTEDVIDKGQRRLIQHTNIHRQSRHSRKPGG